MNTSLVASYIFTMLYPEVLANQLTGGNTSVESIIQEE